MASACERTAIFKADIYAVADQNTAGWCELDFKRIMSFLPQGVAPSKQNKRHLWVFCGTGRTDQEDRAKAGGESWVQSHISLRKKHPELCSDLGPFMMGGELRYYFLTFGFQKWIYLHSCLNLTGAAICLGELKCQMFMYCNVDDSSCCCWRENVSNERYSIAKRRG